MEALSLSPRIIRRLASMLREIRRCAFGLSGEYQRQFNGYVDALLDLEFITWDQWMHLSGLALKVWQSANRMDMKRINARVDALILQCSPVEVVQDESEQVSASAAPGQLRVLRLLDAPGLQRVAGQPLKSSAYVNIESFDGLRPDRIEFPRLGKHWSPASVLVGYQERKGHSVCRA